MAITIPTTDALMRHIRVLIILITSIVLLSSCNTTKYVPDGEYLLSNTKIKCDNRNISKSEAKSYLRQTENAKLFDFIPFNVGCYSLSSPDTAIWINRFLRKMGEPPVIYDSTLTVASEKELKKFMDNKGYRHSEVSSTVTFRKKKAKVTYDIKANEPYTIRNIRYRSRNDSIQKIISADSANTLFKSGDIFDTNVLEKERTRLTKTIRNHGYYTFDKEYVTYLADSALGTNQVDLDIFVRQATKRVNARENVVVPHDVYAINSVNYYALHDVVDILDENAVDSLQYRRYKDKNYWYNEKFVRPSALNLFTYIDSGAIYSERDVEQTYAKLSALHIFKYLDISFQEVTDSSFTDTTGLKKLDCNIIVTRDKNQSFSFEIEGTNNEGDFGIASKLAYQHGNIFRGGEVFRFNVRGATESIINTRTIWEISTEAGLSLPRFFFPFITKEFERKNTAKTEIYVNFSYQIRSDYSRIIAGTGIRYNWQSANKFNHQIDLLDFNYVYLPFMSDSLKNTIGNSLLKYSYEDHLIMRTGYTISFTHKLASTNTISFRGGIDIGGNLLYGICAAANAPKNDAGSYLAGNIPFAQYVKSDVDLAYNVKIDSKNNVVGHFGLGVGVPYCNSTILPFEKRYYGGGANSVRGWSARALGPGSYNPGTTIDYMKQSGDISLNMNLEYRTKLVWKLELAAFLDAGNIWTLKDEGTPGGQFKWDRFIEQIALGYGIGVRLNFDFFVLRLDWGIKAFDPSKEDGERWRFTNTWGLKDMALHFAVGYPF